ncbi:MAG: ABC transporter, fused permease protein [Cytophagales bacterium]|jgi:putative ABC transport system permease protein|nr:ABC transporter permease [Bacteroidota bacterium]MBS1979616.1 ABC transporter permease [Bacteroidota bacterium]WHZ09183.1 MAG: ABC transporter, fused permease protein [Cytophagales bacterium]
MIEYIIKLKRKTKFTLLDGWMWRMAWRDGRHNFSRLFLFMSSLVTGIAAVVAISSLNYSLQDELDQNTKELVGADLVITGNKKMDSTWWTFLSKANVQIARDADLASMALFLNTGKSRLVQVTGMEGTFPFYGQLETQPADAYSRIQSGDYVMLDDALARQYEISSDDSVRLGNKKFVVAGVVTKMPGSGALAATIAPSVYISMKSLAETGLIQFGSRVNYNIYVKTISDKETEKLIEKIKPLAKKLGNGLETVEGRKENLGESFKSVYRFFSLLAFVALILGCIGVASSVHIYAREKRDEVAMLRCIGLSGWQAFTIYFIQVFVLGVIGCFIGALLGAGIHQFIPVVFKDYLPGNAEFLLSWRAMVEGISIGIIVSILFTVLPLVSVRFVPPLTVLRADFIPGKVFSKTRLVVIFLIILFPVFTAAYQTKNILTGVFFSLGIAVALGGLVLVANGLLYLIRKFFPSRASFSWRHALSNLYRPNNQTRLLMVAIGLGTFIISVLNIIQASLLNQVEYKGNKNQSNTILFDIQPGQKEGVVKLINEQHIKMNQLVPIITCRLKELKGRSVEDIQKDTISIPEWALTREYRVTYRDSLTASEKLIKGKLHHFDNDKKDSVFVTISERMQETLRVDIGDSLVFDVQGVLIKVFISGIRKVEWPKDPPNFIFVFPAKVLEQAPQIWVVATRIDEAQKAAKFQQELVINFPNVSLIDLRLVLSTVNELFERIALVVRFLAMFSIITGLVVLAGAVINSKYVRSKENVLLRTVGARTKQIVNITLIEYGYLGLFSSLTALILSLGGGWLLTKFFFDVQLAANYTELLLICIGVLVLTVFIGWFNSREVINTSPLQALRKSD